MDSIIPVLLAGGSGTRLWPLSRKLYPKQFSHIIDDTSLFQQSALRLTSSKKVKFEPHITLTNSDFRFIVSEQLISVGIDPNSIIIEPESKNTAPAILMASIFAYNKNKNSVLLAAPSDHVIPDNNKFHDTISIGLKETQKGKIVVFGVQPTHPKTNFGYIKLEEVSSKNIFKSVNFIEKPNKSRAKKMLESGNYLWNSGIFLFRAKDMIEAFTRYMPNLIPIINESLKKSKIDLGFLRLDQQAWSFCEDVSIDYAIMEKLDNLSVVPLTAGWTDLGDWETVWKEMKPDQNGVSLSSNAHAIECNNTLLRSESEQQVLVGLGLKDIIAIAMPDAVLVTHKDMAQDTKKIVATLKAANIAQAEICLKNYRPWGSFQSLAISNRFQVKRISVNPGAAISLQSHHHRSEHWIVVEGTAKVTIQENVNLLTEGQSVFIPLGAVHRLENPGKLPIVLIEIQTGEYLGEDDIIRYEDIYSRS
ncbi:mannose-1-phosphate guanylyltransferase/mannose-6-phosphate isomerase [Alphaproteobacteria bacterium]|nr:mannose-1-phosphate guanylyltransferase/mannose-6-phosphate isomerase [Alphaproteobacteria bacterium]